MQQWEYLTTFLAADAQERLEELKRRYPAEKVFSPHTPRALIPELDKFGEDGWELVSLTPVANGEDGDIQIHPATTFLLAGAKIWSYVYLAVFKRPKPV